MAFDEDRDDDWLPESARMRPDITALMLQDGARDFDPADVISFLEKLAEGYGPVEIGLSLGWSMSMIDRFRKDPERAAIMDMIEEAEYESVERAIRFHAKQGNSTAMKLYAFNKMGHRGWADRKEVAVTGQSQMEIVLSVREAMDATMREAITTGGSDAVAALQAGLLDRDDDIVDADIVED